MLDKWLDVDTKASWERIAAVIHSVNTGEQSCICKHIVTTQNWGITCTFYQYYMAIIGTQQDTKVLWF